MAEYESIQGHVFKDNKPIPAHEIIEQLKILDDIVAGLKRIFPYIGDKDIKQVAEWLNQNKGVK